MKVLLLCIALVLSALLCAAEPKPEFVLVEHSPWKASVMAESPTFALYDDGTVIFRKPGEESRSGYFTTKIDLDSADYDSLRPLDRSLYSRSYTLTRLGRQPTTIFYWPEKQVSVYGRISQRMSGFSSTPMLADIHREESQLRLELPTGISEAFEAVKGFEVEEAEEWRPEYIEVMIWAYDHASEAPLEWPKDWPGLDDERTLERGVGTYSIYVPGNQLEELQALLATRNPRSAIIIDDRKWDIAHRLPFPGEELWLKNEPVQFGEGE